MNPLKFTPVTISSGQTESSAIDLTNGSLCGIYLPATFTGTTLSFKTSLTLDGTYQPWTDAADVLIALVVAQGKNYPLNPADYIGIRFLKLVATSQSQNSIVNLAIRDFQ